jgi:hypothetical protein
MVLLNAHDIGVSVPRLQQHASWPQRLCLTPSLTDNTPLSKASANSTKLALTLISTCTSHHTYELGCKVQPGQLH